MKTVFKTDAATKIDMFLRQHKIPLKGENVIHIQKNSPQQPCVSLHVNGKILLTEKPENFHTTSQTILLGKFQSWEQLVDSLSAFFATRKKTVVVQYLN